MAMHSELQKVGMAGKETMLVAAVVVVVAVMENAESVHFAFCSAQIFVNLYGFSSEAFISC